MGRENVFGSGTRYSVLGHSAESRSNPSVQQHTLCSTGKSFSSGAHQSIRQHILQPRGTCFGPIQQNALEFSHFLLSGDNDFSPGKHHSVCRHFQIYETTPPRQSGGTAPQFVVWSHHSVWDTLFCPEARDILLSGYWHILWSRGHPIVKKKFSSLQVSIGEHFYN